MSRAKGGFMNLFTASLVAVSLTFVSAVHAQEGAPSSTPPPVAAPRAEGGRFACRLSEARGIPDADASTASFLVCRELSRAAHGQGGFEVSLMPLGPTVVASVTRIDTGESRSATLASISEIVVAAPRLADALLQGKPMEDTRRVQSVLASEAEAPKAISGQRHIALHVVGMAPLGGGLVGAGAGFGYLYEMPRWSVGGHIEIAGRDDAKQDKSFTSVSIGSSVRRFFGDGDVAPFVGVGMGLAILSLESPGAPVPPSQYAPRHDHSGTLLAPFVEGGVSAFRTTRGRFVASVRVDAPLGRLEDTGYSDQKAAPKYVLPLSFRVGVQF